MDPNQNGRPFTIGEKLAGVSFNPGGSPSVTDVKHTAASFMDSINSAENRIEVPSENNIRAKLFEAAKLRALEAQMLAVKAITWQD